MCPDCQYGNADGGGWQGVFKNILQPHTLFQRLDKKDNIDSKALSEELLRDEEKKTNTWIYVGAAAGVITITAVLIWAFKK